MLSHMGYKHKFDPHQVLISEAALFVNCPAGTLRRWDREKGRPKFFYAKRTKSGYRYYTVPQLKLIKDHVGKSKRS